jgi:hypothetical protein
VQYRGASPVAFVETALFTGRLMRLGLEASFHEKHEQHALSADQKAALRTLARRIRAEAGEE